MENIERKFRLGLDIGTNSVGYALVDQNGKIIKKNGHAFWGVRMFGDAKTAKDRGNYRRNRRRLARRNERVKIIRELFAPEIAKVDETFYERLDDSFYYKEDKRNFNTYNIFTSEYTDKEFYDEYPTIYHLRKAMLNEDKEFDIRMLYLVVSHMIKYRGNFLYSGDSFSTSDLENIKNIFIELNNTIKELDNDLKEDEYYNEHFFDVININDEFLQNLNNIMINTKGKNKKKEELYKLFKLEDEDASINKKSLYNELVIALLAGSDVNLANLSIIKDKNKDKKYDKVKINLGDPLETLEETLSNASSEMTEIFKIIEYIPKIKEIIDFYFVSKLLTNAKTLSDAMVKMYDYHQDDLKRLKSFFKTYDKKSYSDVFRLSKDNKKDKIANYPAYIGMNSTNSRIDRFSHANKEEFYKFLKHKIEEIKTSNLAGEELSKFNVEKEYFLGKIDNNEFLLRQNSGQNGVIPMQLHLTELKQILEKQAKYHHFLNDVSDGYTVKDKIIMTFKFKVPYYVGPLNTKSENSWVERNSFDKIYPWNFDSIVNRNETAIKFIQRMQNKCTYLKGDDDYCLPKKSIIFSEYECLSYLNKIHINGKFIEPKIKEQLFNKVFLKEKQPTKKDIIDFFKDNFGESNVTTTKKELPEVTCNMQSYIVMKEIFKDEFESKKDMIEDIIRDIAIFEDKSILENRLRNLYKLDNEKIKKIKGLNYQGYGRLCKRLLVGLNIIDDSTGEIKGTLLSIMRETNLNLQEILYHEKYNFLKTIDEYNKEFINNDTNYTVDDFIEDNLIISPSFKRALIQAYTIIKEIEKIFNHKIDEYYIECARSNKAEKKATKSRYEHVKELYKECNQLALDYHIDLKKLEKNLDDNKDKLKSDLLYFYFTQLGKCMYSLEDINLDDLIQNNHKYDIDHIYPQSIIKDDSKSNRVLALKTLNAKKTDKFLFEAGVINPQAQLYYKKLLEHNLISNEKYKRLTEKEISQEALDGFVNRQIVSTNQAVKGLITLLKDYHNVDEKNIIYSKAENISDFRHKFDLVKSRTANNFHHAHDAYLNVVVGGVLDKYYKMRRFYNYKDIDRMKVEKFTINPDKIFEKTQIKNIWDKNEMLKMINKNLYERFDITETFKTDFSNEMFSKVTILPKGDGKLVPVQTSTKRCDTTKYGGITSQSYCKYVIIRTKIKKTVETILEAIPRSALDDIPAYLKTKYDEFEILNNNIKTNVVIEDGKRKFLITGVSKDNYLCENANDRIFSKEAMKTIKKIDKYLDNKKFEINMSESDTEIILSPARNEETKTIILKKEEVINLFNELNRMYNKEIYSFNSIITLKNNIDKCYELSLKEMINVLSEMLKLIKTNERKEANLKILNLAEHFGIITINKKLKLGMKFISESITGYYKKVLYEVK